jgi:hypothetical protein
LNTVIHIGSRARHIPTSPREGGVVWPVQDIASTTPEVWLQELIKGKPYAHTASSIWMHQPKLRTATEKLGAYLTPMWPTPEGKSLWENAVERAVTRVDFAVQRGESYNGRLVGIYLFWLTSCVCDVAKINVHGYNASGDRFIWKYFSKPLEAWVRDHKITYVEASLVDEDVSAEVVTGLRTHLVARITDPVDAGYLEMYAPRG